MLNQCFWIQNDCCSIETAFENAKFQSDPDALMWISISTCHDEKKYTDASPIAPNHITFRYLIYKR